MILFLDFDGVLHPDPCFNARRMFERAPRLAQVLGEFPEVDVVLTTNWRSHKTLAQMVEPLVPELRERVVGATPHFADFRAPAHLMPYRRHAECVQWLVENHATDCEWAALDDRASLFAPQFDYLIDCHSSEGLDDQAAGRLHFAMARARRRMLGRVDALIEL